MSAATVTGWLLDTHALLWMLHGDKRLSRTAVAAVDGTLPVYHSSVSFWEIAIKLSGKGFDFQIDPDWNRIFPDELKRIGYQGELPTGGRPIHAFFELHIEQGPILEAENLDVGVVTHGQGQRWSEIKLTG